MDGVNITMECRVLLRTPEEIENSEHIESEDEDSDVR